MASFQPLGSVIVMSILVISQFTIANGTGQQVQDAFKNRPHLVDGVAGFMGMEVLNTQGKTDEFWLLTWWTDEAAYQSWHKSQAYQQSHQSMPKGVKLVPGSTKITVLERITN